MSILYDVVDLDTLKDKSFEFKKELLNEIILTGKYEYFSKFIKLFDNIQSVYTSDEILSILPMNIDYELFDIIIHSFEFKQGESFFYNYAHNTENPNIKESVYNYFVENYSDILISNMSMYEKLLEN